MGICVILFAAAMIAQAVAGLQMLRIIRPLLQKQLQLTNEAKHLLEISETMIRDATPRLLTTGDKARDLAKTTAERASDWKRGLKGIAEPLARVGGSSRAKPKKIRTPAGTASGQGERKIEKDS